MEITFNQQITTVFFKGDFYRRIYNYETNHLIWEDATFGYDVDNSMFNTLEEEFQKINTTK